MQRLLHFVGVYGGNLDVDVLGLHFIELRFEPPAEVLECYLLHLAEHAAHDIAGVILVPNFQKFHGPLRNEFEQDGAGAYLISAQASDHGVLFVFEQILEVLGDGPQLT